MTERTKAVLALAIATAVWSFPLIFVKTLSFYFDGWTQNFYRYFCAMVFLILWLKFHRGGLGIRSVSHFARFVIPAIPCLLFQILWVFSMYFPKFYPGQGSLLGKSVAVFGALFGFVFFPEERKQILSFPYLGGLAAATVGAVGIVLADPNRTQEVYFLGAVFTVVSTAFWALYSVAMKRLMRDTHPVSAFGAASVWLTFFFLVLMLWLGEPLQIIRVPVWVVVLVIASGVACIGLGHTLFFYAIRTMGVAIPSVVQLATPLTTPLFRFLLVGETLTAVQIVWGGVLMVGAAATLRARDATPSRHRAGPSGP